MLHNIGLIHVTTFYRQQTYYASCILLCSQHWLMHVRRHRLKFSYKSTAWWQPVLSQILLLSINVLTLDTKIYICFFLKKRQNPCSNLWQRVLCRIHLWLCSVHKIRIHQWLWFQERDLWVFAHAILALKGLDRNKSENQRLIAK